MKKAVTSEHPGKVIKPKNTVVANSVPSQQCIELKKHESNQQCPISTGCIELFNESKLKVNYHKFADDLQIYIYRVYPIVLTCQVTWIALFRDSVTATVKSNVGWLSRNSN